MNRYRIGDVAEIIGVSPDTARRLADSGRLGKVSVEGGHRQIDGVALARFLRESAPDQSAPTVSAQSARNHFPGVVTKVTKDGVMAQVEIQAGPHRVVSLMSREAADELGLMPGVRAVATVKSTNVTVEIP
ncbi:MAG TPA: TOBE domain-containing protein [Candidatus Dormibacteraeota bacterium]|jgi:molybdopterin-binding protein|nr:TOBE domain-containing protein [Candidatus Dormibacteraeota bacterium]